MVNIATILLGTFAFVISCIKGEFSIQITKFDCIVHDPTTAQNVTCYAKPYNRTVTRAVLSGYAVRELNDIMLNVQLYKKSEILYRPFLVNFTQNYCDFVAKKSLGTYYMKYLRDIISPYSNLNHPCPYSGYIYIKDLPLDASQVPSVWPAGSYRMDFLIFVEDRSIVTLQCSLEVKELINRSIRKFI